jgi:hypothetical protein
MRTILTGQLDVTARAEGLAVPSAGRQIRHAGVPQLRQGTRMAESLVQQLACNYIWLDNWQTEPLDVHPL